MRDYCSGVLRRFRSSIVCPAAAALNRNLRRELIHDFYLSSSITPDPEDLKAKAADTRFRNSSGTVVFTAHRTDAAALFSQLSEIGRPIKSGALIDMVAKNFAGADREALRGLLEQIGLQLVLKGVISLYAEEGNYVSDISEMPEASRLARYQASVQDWATNAWHEKINHDQFTRLLIEHLDGTRSINDLCQIMLERVDKGALGVQLDGKDIADTEQRRLVIRQLTENALNSFARAVLLVA